MPFRVGAVVGRSTRARTREKDDGGPGHPRRTGLPAGAGARSASGRAGELDREVLVRTHRSVARAATCTAASPARTDGTRDRPGGAGTRRPARAARGPRSRSRTRQSAPCGPTSTALAGPPSARPRPHRRRSGLRPSPDAGRASRAPGRRRPGGPCRPPPTAPGAPWVPGRAGGRCTRGSARRPRLSPSRSATTTAPGRPAEPRAVRRTGSRPRARLRSRSQPRTGPAPGWSRPGRRSRPTWDRNRPRRSGR